MCQTYVQTEDATIAFINGLLDFVHYDKLYITNIEKLNDSKYQLTIVNPDITTYKEYFVSTGAKYSGEIHKVTHTIENDKITSILYKVYISGSVTYGNDTYPVSLDVEAKNTFE